MQGVDANQIDAAGPPACQARAAVAGGQNDVRLGRTQRTLLCLVCIGMAVSIVADLLILVYFGLM
jgi:hypothetical protein